MAWCQVFQSVFMEELLYVVYNSRNKARKVPSSNEFRRSRIIQDSLLQDSSETAIHCESL